MNTRNGGLFIWCASLALMPVCEAAGVLLKDNFNDNSLDTAKWVVYADTRITPGASVTEVRQWIEMHNRGHLVTVDEFMPTATGGVTIRGRVTFVDSEFEDSFQVRTRTDGIRYHPLAKRRTVLLSESTMLREATLTLQSQYPVQERSQGSTGNLNSISTRGKPSISLPRMMATMYLSA